MYIFINFSIIYQSISSIIYHLLFISLSLDYLSIIYPSSFCLSILKTRSSHQYFQYQSKSTVFFIVFPFLIFVTLFSKSKKPISRYHYICTDLFNPPVLISLVWSIHHFLPPRHNCLPNAAWSLRSRLGHSSKRKLPSPNPMMAHPLRGYHSHIPTPLLPWHLIRGRAIH